MRPFHPSSRSVTAALPPAIPAPTMATTWSVDSPLRIAPAPFARSGGPRFTRSVDRDAKRPQLVTRADHIPGDLRPSRDAQTREREQPLEKDVRFLDRDKLACAAMVAVAKAHHR